MRRSKEIRHPRFLEDLFRKPPPGLDAQMKMIPVPRIGHRLVDGMKNTCIKAGVLILLYFQEGHLHIVLTRRTDRVSHHQSQISFPGGRKNPEESLEQAALREAREELSVSPEDVRILGSLTPLYVPPSNFCIYPIVGFSAARPDFKPDPEEVAEIIEIPLAHLLNSGNVKREDWMIRGMRVRVPFYQYGDDKVWGATAMVLSEFLEVFKGSDVS